MAASHFSGPVYSANGFVGNITGNVTGNISGGVSGAVAATTLSASTSLAVGASGASIKAINSGVVSLDPGTLAAGAEIDLTATITGLAAGDMVSIVPPNAAAETGLSVALVWVSAANTIKVRCSNLNAVAALVGGAQNWTYLWHDLT